MTSPDEVGFDAVASAWMARTAAEAAQVWQVTVPEAGAWIMEFGASNGLTAHDQDVMWSLLRSLPEVLSRVQLPQHSDQPPPVEVADESDIVGALLDVDPEHEESILAGWRFVAENSSAESISDLATTHSMYYYDACQLVLSFGRANGMTESDPDAMWKQLQTESAERARLIDEFMAGSAADMNSGQPEAATPVMSARSLMHDFDLYVESTNYVSTTKETLRRNARQFVGWCPADTDWNNRERCEELRSEYVESIIDSAKRGKAGSAARHVLDMLSGFPAAELGRGRPREPLLPWLAEHQSVLRDNGYEGRVLESEISRIRVYVKWVDDNCGAIDWRSGSDRLSAWERCRQERRFGHQFAGPVRRWNNVLTGSPLGQGRSPWMWNDIPVSSGLEKYIPPPPRLPAAHEALGAQVASVAERSKDLAEDVQVRETSRWKFHQMDPNARPEKRPRLDSP